MFLCSNFRQLAKYTTTLLGALVHTYYLWLCASTLACWDCLLCHHLPRKTTYAARINVCFIEIDVLHSSLISITCPGKPELYKIGKTKRKKGQRHPKTKILTIQAYRKSCQPGTLKPQNPNLSFSGFSWKRELLRVGWACEGSSLVIPVDSLTALTFRGSCP